MHADAGDQGAEKHVARRGHTWHIVAKRASVKAMPEGESKDAVKHIEHMKAAVCAKVEHPFRVVKRQFGYRKLRFKGPFKNTAQVLTPFASANSVDGATNFARIGGRGAPVRREMGSIRGESTARL